MASATVNGASLVANYNNKNSATGGGGGGASPTSGVGDDEQMSSYTNINLNNNNVDDRWSRDSNDGGGGGGRKRAASTSYIADDEINPPSSSSASAAKSSKKRRKQSNPVRLATCSSRGSVDKMAIDDEYRDNLMASNVRVSSSSVVHPDDFDSPAEDEGLAEEGEMTSSSQQHQQQIRAIVKVIEEEEEEEERARAEEEDDDEFDDGRVHRCPHCNVLFDVKEHLSRHVEVEHVQKILERQLQQQNQKNFASGGGGAGVECKRTANSPFDLSTASSSSVSANFPRFDGRHSNSSSSDTSLAEENKLFHHTLGGGAAAHHSLHHHSPSHHHHQQQQQQQQQSNAPNTSKDLPPASLMALSAFGAAPFLIPVLPSSSSSAPLLQRGSAIPNSLSSGSSMAGMGGNGSGSCSTLTRIFNPEAFCELCNKEFCNKYFLKTHKANKHGVYSLEALTSASQTTPTSTITSSSSHPNSFSPSNNTNNIINTMNNGGSGIINNGGGGGSGGVGNIINNNNNNNNNNMSANRHHRRSGSGMGSGSSPPLSMDGVQTPPINLRDGQLNMGPLLSTSAAVSLGMLSNKMLPVMNPEAFCDICQKEFCNKYFLKKHRQKIHGIQDPPSLNSSGSNPPVTTSASSLVSAAAVANSISALVDSIAAVAAANNTTPSELVNLHNSTFGQTGGGGHHHHPIPPADLFYEYSARDLSAKIAAATQANSKHSIQNLMGVAGGAGGGAKTNSNAGSPSNGASANVTTTGSASGGADNSPLPLFISGQMNNNNGGSGGGGGGGGGSCSPSGESGRWIPGCITVAGHVFTPERLREMGVINVDAFCEICCKEFCNKYFLRTHKMNKHGVGVAPGEFPVPPTTTTSGNVLIKSPSSTSHSHMGNPAHHTSLSSSSSSQDKQQQPLSLVMDKDGCQASAQQIMAQLHDQDSGRKSINSPGSNHSGSSYGRSTLMAANLVSVQLEHPPSSPLPLDSTQETGNVSQDLICEVCSRPFSSTYLLKMHKFYFHNSSMAAAAAALGGVDVTSSLIEEHIAVAEAMRRRCASDGGSSVSGKSGDQSPNSVQETGSGPINDELQKLQSMIRELNTSPGATAMKDCNSEVRCSVCLKEMKNKYFLRAHMMNEHGELHNEDVDASPPDCFNVALKNEPEDYSDGGERTTPSNKSANVSTSANDPESTFCDFCGKDMCSKYFLRAHQLTAHAHEIQIKQEINPLNLNQMLLPVHPDRIKTENAAAATAAAVGALNLAAISQHHHQQQMSSMMVSPSPMTSSSQDQRSNVTGRNFCEICNKELCNKYFMKTHMLKMHGINVDDKIHSGGVNGATIGGVMCDICQKELCSKYFLKVHKQNTHGCYEETPPISKENYVAAAAAAAVAAAQQQQQQQQQQHQQQLDAMQSQLSNDGYASDGVTTTTSSNGNRYFSHYTEVCPLCDRRFKSIKWLKTHVINDHADLAKDSGLAELLATESYLASTGDFSPPPPPLTTTTNNNNHRLPSLQQQQQRHSMQQQRNLSSPRDYLNESISPGKGSSKSPNSFLSHHYHSISRHANAAAATTSATADDGDVTSSVTAATTTTTTATTTSAATTAIFQADELGSTGAALATIATAGTSAGGGVGNGGCGVNDGGGGSGEGGGGGSREGGAEHKRSMLSMYSLHHHRPRANAGIIRKPITTTTTTGSGGATTRIYHCSYCTYSTRWLSNLYAHEKRHTGLSNEGEKRFSCRVCHRAYRYNHSLQRHLVSHKTTGMLFKHVMSSASNNNHVFSSNSALSQQISSSNQQRNTSPEAESAGKEMMSRGGNQQQLIQYGNNGGATNLTSGSKAPIRIKKYRCSKCGAKYRSREQCLEHIHMNHSNAARGFRRRNAVDNNVTTTSTSTNNNNKISAAGRAAGSGELQCPGCEFSCLSNEAMVIHINRHHQEEASEAENDQPSFDFDVRKLKNPNYPAYNDVETAEMTSPQRQAQLPMTYAVPQAPPTAGSFIMQPFLITQQGQSPQPQPSEPSASPGEATVTTAAVTASGSTSPNVTTTNSGSGKELKSHNTIPTTFVPSLVYLPVSRKINDTVTVTFNLIPA